MGSLVGLSAAIALVAGPLLGALLIFVTDAPLALLNIVAGVVYALALPFVALVTAYVYFDARTRDELEPDEPRRAPRGDRARCDRQRLGVKRLPR